MMTPTDILREYRWLLGELHAGNTFSKDEIWKRLERLPITVEDEPARDGCFDPIPDDPEYCRFCSYGLSKHGPHEECCDPNTNERDDLYSMQRMSEQRSGCDWHPVTAPGCPECGR